MAIVVDSSVLIAMLFDEADRDRYVEFLAGVATPVLPAPAYLEVSMVIESRLMHGVLDGRIDALMARFGIEIIPCDAAIARVARTAFSRYGRGRSASGQPAARLNFGDCLVYAMAKSLNLPLLFKGDDFARTDIIPALPAGESA
jgi:ribonuclease VapC